MNKITSTSQNNEMDKVALMLIVVFIGSVLFWITAFGIIAALIYWLISLF